MLKSIETISDPGRISSIDIFRGVAIVTVVLFHFNNLLPYGQLGVDLFFVISGFLVGGLLTKDFVKGTKITFTKFFLQRGFKIWPSYYAFLILGNLVCFLFYMDYAPAEYIPLNDLKRYLLFYQNYTGAPYHVSFDGVWSLCVEEHFYIMLPIAFIVLQALRGNKNMLLLSVTLMICAGIVFKILALYYTNSKDTTSGTQYRIDALGWGVLLSLLMTYYPQNFKKSAKHILVFIAGLLLLAVTITIDIYTSSVFYKKIMLHTLAPLSCFLMIAGVYKYDFSKFSILRFIAYYSYNWYLWHPIVRPAIAHYIGYNGLGLASYLISTFLLAMLFTVLVEETFMKWRKPIIDRLFNKPLVLKGS
jgi:peptidoglycan/LPS O-acetylase OafA/YrhL